MANKDRALTQEELFDAIAAANKVTTFSQQAPNGGVFIWVTAAEKNPLAALLRCAVNIILARGGSAPVDSPVSITRCAVFAPGSEYYWQVTDGNGQILHDGYAATREAAGAEVTKHLGNVL